MGFLYYQIVLPHSLSQKKIYQALFEDVKAGESKSKILGLKLSYVIVKLVDFLKFSWPSENTGCFISGCMKTNA